MNTKCADDHTSDRVDIFSVEKARKKRIKVSIIFIKDLTRNLVEHSTHLFPLD